MAALEANPSVRQKSLFVDLCRSWALGSSVYFFLKPSSARDRGGRNSLELGVSRPKSACFEILDKLLGISGPQFPSL